MSVINDLLTGEKLPAVDFNVTVDDHSIVKVGVMVVVAAVIIILVARVVKSKK